MEYNKPKLKDEWNRICGLYCREFINWYFCYENGFSDTYLWVTDDPNGVLCVGDDMFFDMTTIRYAVDNKVWKEDLMEWYDYCLTVADLDIKSPTLESWCNGASRISDKQLGKLAKMKHEFEDEVKKYNSRWEKGGF